MARKTVTQQKKRKQPKQYVRVPVETYAALQRAITIPKTVKEHREAEQEGKADEKERVKERLVIEAENSAIMEQWRTHRWIRSLRALRGLHCHPDQADNHQTIGSPASVREDWRAA